MRKINWNSPMTRKDFAILCGLSYGWCIAIYAIFAVAIRWNKIKTWTWDKVKWFRNKLPL